jgi:nucleotide-binding universal stress UspA family protein
MGSTFIVPLDGSATTERAAHVAARLARSSVGDAEIVLTAVTPRRAAAAMELRRLAGELPVGGVRCEVLDGEDVGAALGELVDTTGDPIVCMTTHGRARARELVIGSTAGELLRRVAVPFVLVGPKCSGDWSVDAPRLLACLDESPTSDAILHPAGSFCRARDWELWLAEVFQPLDAASTLSAWRYTDRVAEELRTDDFRVRTVSGWSRHPADEILHLRSATSASVIAMATHGRTGLERVVLGSVTMSVVHRAPCPVLTIRPSGLG